MKSEAAVSNAVCNLSMHHNLVMSIHGMFKIQYLLIHSLVMS